MVELKSLVHVFMLVKPKGKLTQVQIEADENVSGCGSVKGLHLLYMADWVVDSQVNVLTADRADDLPAMYAMAEAHVRKDQLVLLLKRGLFVFWGLCRLLVSDTHLEPTVRHAGMKLALRVDDCRLLESQDTHVVLEAPDTWRILELALDIDVSQSLP